MPVPQIELAKTCSTCTHAAFNKVSEKHANFTRRRFSGLCVVVPESPRLCHRQCTCEGWKDAPLTEPYARSVVKGTRKL